MSNRWPCSSLSGDWPAKLLRTAQGHVRSVLTTTDAECSGSGLRRRDRRQSSRRSVAEFPWIWTGKTATRVLIVEDDANTADLTVNVTLGNASMLVLSCRACTGPTRGGRETHSLPIANMQKFTWVRGGGRFREKILGFLGSLPVASDAAMIVLCFL